MRKEHERGANSEFWLHDKPIFCPDILSMKSNVFDFNVLEKEEGGNIRFSNQENYFEFSEFLKNYSCLKIISKNVSVSRDYESWKLLGFITRLTATTATLNQTRKTLTLMWMNIKTSSILSLRNIFGEPLNFNGILPFKCITSLFSFAFRNDSTPIVILPLVHPC